MAIDQLPPGFVVDQPPSVASGSSDLPPGFQVDSSSQPKPSTDDVYSHDTSLKQKFEGMDDIEIITNNTCNQ